MNPLLIAGGITALVAGLTYKYGRPTSMNKGDAAAVGDRVDVPTAALPQGALPAAIPAGAGYIVITVQNVTADSLDGMITGFLISNEPRTETSLPIPVGPVRVPRSVVTNVSRTKQVAAPRPL